MSGIRVSDPDEGMAWLESMTPELRLAIACRAVLRTFPVLARTPSEHFEDTMLFCFRRVLLTTVRLRFGFSMEGLPVRSGIQSEPSPNFGHETLTFELSPKQQIHACSDLDWARYEYETEHDESHQRWEPRNTLDAIWASAQTLTNKSELINGGFKAVLLDAALPDLEMQRTPVWKASEIPSEILQDHKNLNTLLEEKSNCGFFHDWYLKMWEGAFRNWNLAYAVACIDDAVWEAGLTAVAAQVTAIQQKHRTDISPKLVQVSDGIWGIENDVSVPQEPLDFAIAQVQIALKAALAVGQNNGLRPDSGETVLIETACTKYRHQPSAVSTSFWSACMSLQRDIGDVYPEDSVLIVLQNTLYTSVEELCEQDPLIKSRIARLAALETRRYPTRVERLELQKVPDAVAENTTPEVQEELREMVDIVSAEQKPPRLIRAKLVNWITTLGTGIDRAQKGEKRAKWLFDLARRIGGWFFDENDPSD